MTDSDYPFGIFKLFLAKLYQLLIVKHEFIWTYHSLNLPNNCVPETLSWP